MPTKKTTEAESNENPSAALAWGTTAFSVGEDVGLVARNTVGLVARDNPSTRERLWKLVAQDAPLDDILDELSSTGLKALPDFGIAQVEGADVRVVARGRTIISAELSSGETHEIDPSDVRTWIEEVVENVATITISLPGGDSDTTSETFAVLAGSVPASSLTRRYDAPDDHAEEAESGAGWSAGDEQPEDQAPVHDTPPADAAPADAEPADAADAAETSAAETSAEDIAAAPDVDLELVDDLDDGDLGDGAADAASESAVDADSQPADPQPAAPQPPAPFLDSAADASVTELEPADPQPADPQPADPQPADPQPPAPPTSPSGPPPSGPGVGGPPPPDPSGAIFGGSAPEATVVVGSEDGPARGPVSSIFDDAVAPISGAMPGDDPEATLGQSDLNEAQAAAEHTAAAPGGAPVYGVLVFSNGERIDVDRAVLIGRNPKVAGAVEGGLPHIMKFDGPGQGLSRTHAEVRIEDGAVVIEDLQSTNGTEIQLPGQQRRRLQGGEPEAIVPGTEVDFGGELRCTLESAS